METPISPKVIVSVIVGIVLTAIVSNISAITPDMLDFLGPWKLFVFGVVITAITGLAGWWKTDPLRVVPTSTWQGDGHGVADTEAAKQTSLASTAVNVPATTFPAAKVNAALDAPEPVTVTPVYDTPAV